MRARIDPARSLQMALVKSKDTKPENVVRALVSSLGIKFSIDAPLLNARPDLIFARRKKAIFVHGCFWHQHKKARCWRSRVPKTRQDFWVPKLEANVRRDMAQVRKLRRAGWSVLTVWECETSPTKLPTLKKRLGLFLQRKS